MIEQQSTTSRKARPSKKPKRAPAIVGRSAAPRGKGPGEILDPELGRLADEIRASVDGLRGLLLQAVPRKLQLGELLTEARDRCRGSKGAWTTFLAQCGIKERTAREAIQFFGESDEIKDMERHGGAELTVKAVRDKIAKPRGKGDKEVLAETIVGDELRPSPAVARGLPRPIEMDRSDAGARDVETHGGWFVEPVQVDDAPGSPIAPGSTHLSQVDPAESSIESQAAPDSLPVEIEFISLIGEMVNQAIDRLSSGPTDSEIEILRRGISEGREALRRLDDALEKLDQQETCAEERGIADPALPLPSDRQSPVTRSPQK